MMADGIGSDGSDKTADDQAVLGEFLSRGLAATRLRMKDLGLDDDAILDPDSSMDQQTAVLRLTFLQAERSGMPFRLNGERFWRIIRARLQPIVLAYLTHETFVRNLDSKSFELRSDSLMDVYRERLSNSDQFRSFFFDLTEKLNKEASLGAVSSSPTAVEMPSSSAVQNQTGDMQKNIIRSLEKQLQDLEKKYNKLEKQYDSAQSENAGLKSALQDRQEELDRVQKIQKSLEEEMIHLRLSADARSRSVASAQPSTAREPLASSDLTMKIQALEQELASTSDAAYSAFMSNSDLGIIILFIMTSFRCHSVEQLAEEVVKSISTFGFESVVGVRKGSGYEYFPSKNVSRNQVTRLQEAVAARRVSANTLMLLQADCSLLVDQDFTTEPDRYEQVKDNLNTLMKGVQARYEAIVAEGLALDQKRKLDSLIVRSHEVFQRYELNMAKQQVKIAAVVNTFAQDARAQLEIRPGEPKSIVFNSEVRKLESAIRKLFNLSELLDRKYVDNINKVAQNILKKDT